MNSTLHRYRRLWALSTTLFFVCAILSASQPALAQPTPLRRVQPAVIATQLYQQLPDFPLENQYVSSETGEIATDNTLISRFIGYHLYIQNRPTNFRFDWKLTLADYLGAFERMSAERYVDFGLRENPIERDIAAIEALSPAVRNAFINALYEALTVPEPDELPLQSRIHP